MPMPPGTRFRVKTIIKNKKVQIRLAFDPKTNKVLEAKKLTKEKK